MGAEASRVGGGGVDDVAACVHLGLCDGVGSGVVPGFSDIEFAVCRSGIGHQGQVADERVGHGHAGQGLVAGVFNGNRVVNDVPCGIRVVAVDACILGDEV
jgi:hypothetical protein